MIESWRQKAEEMFPELAIRFAQADTPYLLWFELRDAFEHAYESSPLNDSVIRRVYEYSDWCLDQPQGRTAEDDLTTCIAVCFYEHIPEHPKARADMPRWFTMDDLLGMEKIFRYHLSDTEFEELKRHFEQNAKMYVPRKPA